MKVCKSWTQEEEEYLRKCYPDPNITYTEMERHLGRTQTSIKGKALYMGLIRVGAIGRTWTHEEDQFIKENFDKGLEEISKHLDNRAPTSVRRRAIYLGLLDIKRRKSKPKKKKEVIEPPAKPYKGFVVESTYTDKDGYPKKHSFKYREERTKKAAVKRSIDNLVYARHAKTFKIRRIYPYEI